MNIFQFISVQVLRKRIKWGGRVKVAAYLLIRGGGGGSKFRKICLYNNWTLPYWLPLHWTDSSEPILCYRHTVHWTMLTAAPYSLSRTMVTTTLEKLHRITVTTNQDMLNGTMVTTTLDILHGTMVTTTQNKTMLTTNLDWTIVTTTLLQICTFIHYMEFLRMFVCKFL